MTLLNPIWLWALGGLTIPIAIHLLSRKEGKTIRIGSIRFLTETSTSKFSSIRLNEVALLAIRSLLIVLIVLFLANLMISSTQSKASKKWVLVEKDLENNEQIKNLLDSLQKNEYEIRRLSAGFPIPENDTATQRPDYYKLSEKLAQQDNVQAIVIAENALSGYRGKRISLPENITWLSYSIRPADVRGDSLTRGDTIRIMLAFEKNFQYDKKIMAAALQALQDSSPTQLVIEETEINNFKITDVDWLIWLSDDTITNERKSLRFSEDVVNDLIIQKSKNQWILTKRLTEENAVEEHLTIQLMSMLFDEQIKQEISQQDNRTQPNELAWSKNNNNQSVSSVKAGQHADKILILIIVLALIGERILAFYRKQ